LADSGVDYCWDTTDRMYIYNWKTSTADSSKQFTIGNHLEAASPFTPGSMTFQCSHSARSRQSSRNDTA
jgi:hypothetical protein